MFKPFYCNNKYFCLWIKRIQWKYLAKTQIDTIRLLTVPSQKLHGELDPCNLYKLAFRKLWNIDEKIEDWLDRFTLFPIIL